MYRRHTAGFSSFCGQPLEQSSITRDLCTVARGGDIQTASEDISLSLVVSGSGHLISYTAVNCRPCDNFRYLGHIKNPDDDDDNDDDDDGV